MAKAIRRAKGRGYHAMVTARSSVLLATYFQKLRCLSVRSGFWHYLSACRTVRTSSRFNTQDAVSALELDTAWSICASSRSRWALAGGQRVCCFHKKVLFFRTSLNEHCMFIPSTDVVSRPGHSSRSAQLNAVLNPSSQSARRCQGQCFEGSARRKSHPQQEPG